MVRPDFDTLGGGPLWNVRAVRPDTICLCRPVRPDAAELCAVAGVNKSDPIDEPVSIFVELAEIDVRIGEETGQLPEMLLKIADVYDDEVDNAVAALTSMLEPLMIVVLALVVGVIVMALFLPLV